MNDENIDHLTNLPNRAAFDEAIQKGFQESTQARPCGLVLADIDYFKKINDKHGHQTGDEILRVVAERLLSVVEGKGTPFRYGGEEFALLLPNHTTDETVAVAERARRSIEAMKSELGTITMSFGVAGAPSEVSSSEQWLQRADEALYAAKDLGRNLVRLWGEPPPEPEQVRAPSRRQPEPGTISDEKKEELRLQYLRKGYVLCPNDQVPMEVHDVTALGEAGRSFIVHCPGCGFSSQLPSPVG